MQVSNKLSEFPKRQKFRLNDCKEGKSFITPCPGTLSSSPQNQSNSSTQPSLSLTPQQFIDIVQNKGAPVTEGLTQANEMLSHCNSCNEKDATRLCLSCNKIWCDGCALDHHEEFHDHKTLKLSKVLENIENEKIKLEKKIVDLENLMNGKEGVSKVLRTREDELMEQVDFFYENYSKVLENQRQAIKNQIQKKLVDVTADYFKNTPNNIQGNDQGIEAFKWIFGTKSLLTDIEKTKITDDNSLLCSLYQQEECFKKLDRSKLNKDCDTAALEKFFRQIEIRPNNQLLKTLEKEDIVEIEIKQFAKKNYQTGSDIEEVKESFSDILQQEVSQNSKKKYQDSSPQAALKNDVLASDWGQKDLPKPALVQKIDISKNFKKAFENKLEIQVKTQKDSDSIFLESISKHNSKNSNVNNGLKNDAHVEIFSEILKTKGLKESCQRVSNLVLDFFNLTEEGVLSLSEAIAQLPSLQTVQLSFYMTLGLYPVYLKPLFQSLAKLKSLKELSLKLPTWTHLKGTAFLPLLSSISNIPTLQSLSLDLSRCSKLDLQGISEALKYLLRHENLEKLQISFKGCINIYDDNKALENLYRNCLNSKFKGIKFDFSECPNLSEESLEVIDDINKTMLLG